VQIGREKIFAAFKKRGEKRHQPLLRRGNILKRREGGEKSRRGKEASWGSCGFVLILQGVFF